MSRPALEIADTFRRHGAVWRAAQAGHVGPGQLKVTSAIESCRTAALGGHVEACEGCRRKLFRRLFLTGLLALHAAGRLRFFATGPNGATRRPSSATWRP